MAVEIDWPIEEVENHTYLLLGHFKQKLSDVVSVTPYRNDEGDYILSVDMNDGYTLKWFTTKTLNGMQRVKPTATGRKVKKSRNDFGLRTAALCLPGYRPHNI